MEENPGYNIRYLNEDELIPHDRLMDAMKHRIESEGYTMAEGSRPGWYYQQFLKMAYYAICDEEYYMSWDMDTVPLRRIEMFGSDGIPFFDIKQEYNPGYFRTIDRLFGFGKVIDRSFVSEHMVFKRDFMEEMIKEINALPYKGESFYEKLFYAIELDNIRQGFSEFETYGSWVAVRHTTSYKLRTWYSLRRGSVFIKGCDITEADIGWLSTDFDAITFEGYTKLDPELSELFKDPEIRKKATSGQFYRLLLENGYFGEYTDGAIKTKSWNVPV